MAPSKLCLPARRSPRFVLRRGRGNGALLAQSTDLKKEPGHCDDQNERRCPPSLAPGHCLILPHKAPRGPLIAPNRDSPASSLTNQAPVVGWPERGSGWGWGRNVGVFFPPPRGSSPPKILKKQARGGGWPGGGFGRGWETIWGFFSPPPAGPSLRPPHD